MMLAYVVALTVATADGGAPKSAPFADVSDSKILEPMPVRAPGPVVNKQSCKNMQMFRGQPNAVEILRHCDEHDRIERQYAADIEAWRKRNGLVQARMVAEEGGTAKRVDPFVGVANRAPDYRTPDEKYLDERRAADAAQARRRAEVESLAKNPVLFQATLSRWACVSRAQANSYLQQVRDEKENARRIAGVVDLNYLYSLQGHVVEEEAEEASALSRIRSAGMKPLACGSRRLAEFKRCSADETATGCSNYRGARDVWTYLTTGVLE